MAEEWVRESLADGTALDALELTFQPVVWLATGELYGAESFIKWRDPERGILPTAAWLPHAVRTGALGGCSRSMLAAWAASSRGAAGPIISFNLLGDQLLDDDFMHEVFGIAPEIAAGLAIEIHQLQWDVERANRVQPQWPWPEVPGFDHRLERLRRHGFSVWVDDFGDGSDDQAVIGHPHIDIVKLDGRFAGADPAVVGRVVSAVHAVSKLALLEHIETEHQQQVAIEAGVDLGQGFLYAPTLTEAEFAVFAGAGTRDR